MHTGFVFSLTELPAADKFPSFVRNANCARAGRFPSIAAGEKTRVECISSEKNTS